VNVLLRWQCQQVKVTSRSSHPGLKVVEFVPQLGQLRSQALALLLGVNRLHVLTSGARTELLDLRHVTYTAAH